MVDEDGNTILHFAIVYGFTDLIEPILSAVPKLISTRNKLGHYPIHTAILEGKEECLKILLKDASAQSLQDVSGETALHYAARHSGKEIVTRCCQAFKDSDVRDNTGRTPLMLAAESGNIEAMKTLVGHGANTQLVDSFGDTLIHRALDNDGKEALAWVLANTNLDINAVNSQGKTALQECELSGDEEKMKLLLAKGATVSSDT